MHAARVKSLLVWSDFALIKTCQNNTLFLFLMAQFWILSAPTDYVAPAASLAAPASPMPPAAVILFYYLYSASTTEGRFALGGTARCCCCCYCCGCCICCCCCCIRSWGRRVRWLEVDGWVWPGRCEAKGQEEDEKRTMKDKPKTYWPLATLYVDEMEKYFSNRSSVVLLSA